MTRTPLLTSFFGKVTFFAIREYDFDDFLKEFGEILLSVMRGGHLIVRLLCEVRLCSMIIIMFQTIYRA